MEDIVHLDLKSFFTFFESKNRHQAPPEKSLTKLNSGSGLFTPEYVIRS